MNLDSQRVLVTGAGGGIGRALCAQLAARGAQLFLVERTDDAVARLRSDLEETAPAAVAIAGDITQTEARQEILRTVNRAVGGVDVVVHLAGMLDFSAYADEDPGVIQSILKVNVEAPMLLTREVLPGMLAQGMGRVVTVGSMFGSIGFPCFAAYSATKFALRGFSEALRRELAGTGVGVTYVSPRAVRTALNPPVVHNMAEQGLMRMDEPQWVAEKIVRAIERDADDVYLGFPEGFFARLNGLLPRLVDRALIKQVPSLLRFATTNKRA
jgi:short-subunit dehydrogenase